ncbi:MAG: hypothetical protein ACLVLH_12485 [Eisenbergiella massiliensis]
MMESIEFLTLENEALSVRILPGLGGKITSLRLKENDFELAAPNTGGNTEQPQGITGRRQQRRGMGIQGRIFPGMTLPDWMMRSPT